MLDFIIDHLLGTIKTIWKHLGEISAQSYKFYFVSFKTKIVNTC
jgi:hypothetical protein